MIMNRVDRAALGYARATALGVLGLATSLVLAILGSFMASLGVVAYPGAFGWDFEVSAIGVFGIVTLVASVIALLVALNAAWNAYSKARQSHDRLEADYVKARRAEQDAVPGDEGGSAR